MAARGRPGYLKPGINRKYSGFRLSQSQLDAVERHRFEKEKHEAFFNRLWQRVAIELNQSDRRLPYAPLDIEPRVKQFTIRFSLPSLEILDRYWKGSTQETVDYLVDWSAQLPVIEPIMSAQEVLTLLTTLIESSNQQRVEASIALDHLTQRCAIACVRQWIAELIRERKLRAIDVDAGSGIARVAINRLRFGFLAIHDLRSTDPQNGEDR